MKRIGVALLGLALLATTHHTTGTHTPAGEYRACFEDEVIVWDGSADKHLHCVPLDDIQEAAIDLYLEAQSQEDR